MKMIGLKEIRKKKKYSQLKVAMDLAISREALSYYENGKRSPVLLRKRQAKPRRGYAGPSVPIFQRVH